MLEKQIKVAIVGGTGYTGVELIRLLATHPRVEISTITSRLAAGSRLSTMFPSFRGQVDLEFSPPDLSTLAQNDVVFFATPNGTAMSMARNLLDKGVRVVDLAADFRLKDPEQWKQWYDVGHACPELLKEAVYGLPELNRVAIREAKLVANPGCYPTAVVLGLLPLIEGGLVNIESLIADAKSGISGAGRKINIDTSYCESAENFKAYSVSGHRHLPEIEQVLTEVTGKRIDMTFVPHLLPMVRGIEATLYAELNDNSLDLTEVYSKRYVAEPFVDVLPDGSHPETRSVKGINVCQIAVHRPQNRKTAVILSVIDNLVKGAAGQAIQNMNIMFDLDETLGLDQVSVLP